MVTADRGVTGGVGQVLVSSAAVHAIRPVRILFDSQHSSLYGDCLVVTLVVRSCSTRVLLDVTEMEGKIRASGMLCLVGLGVGLGSMLLYRLYRKVVAPAWKETRKRPDNPSSLQANGQQQKRKGQNSEVLSPETPDSGISTGTTDSLGTQHAMMDCDGEEGSHRYSSGVLHVGNGVLRSRKRPGSAPPGGRGSLDEGLLLSPTHYKHNKGHPMFNPKHHDQNGNHDDERQQDFIVNVDNNGNEGSPGSTSTPYPKRLTTWAEQQGDQYTRHPRLKRQKESYASDLSGCSQPSYTDSVDCPSEFTACSDIFHAASISSRAESNMEDIQNELRGIRQDINDINEAVQLLHSHENICSQRSYTLGAYEACQTDVRQWVSPPAEFTDETPNKRSEYMWDYQSDLGNTQDAFTSQRPVFAYHSESSGSQSPNHPGSSKNESLPKGAKRRIVRTQTDASITGIFIDDEITDDTSMMAGLEYASDTGGLMMKDISKDQCTVLVQRDSPTDSCNVPAISISESSCTNCGNNFPGAFNPAVANVKRQQFPVNMDQSFAESNASSGIFTSDMSLSSSFMSSRGRRSRSRSSSCARSTESSCTDTVQDWRVSQWEVRNIEGRRNIYEFMETEWPGDTEHEKTMKKGYRQVCSLLGVHHIRRIRSDHYCSVRATLFQAMVHNVPVLNHLGSLSAVLERLCVFENPKYSFLHSWTFGNRLPYSKSGIVETMATCLTALFEQLTAISALQSSSLREDYTITLMNQSPQVDLQLIEAVKFLMVLQAVSIHESTCSSPLLAMKLRLFSRPSAANPELLFRNHINTIGDTITAGQVEMALLGLTLGLKIEVVRPALVGKDHFISHYPDDGADSFPRVYLLAEDDTHYSVPVTEQI